MEHGDVEALGETLAGWMGPGIEHSRHPLSLFTYFLPRVISLLIILLISFISILPTAHHHLGFLPPPLCPFSLVLCL